MLTGIANSGEENESIESRVVVKLTQLSKSLKDTASGNSLFAAAEASTALTHMPKSIVFLCKNNTLTASASLGIDINSPHIAAIQTVVEKAISSVQSIVVSKDSSLSTTTKEALRKAEIGSLLCAPMMISDLNVGTIVVLSDKEHLFSQEDIELLQVIASQTALTAWKYLSLTGMDDNLISEDSQLMLLTQRKIEELSLINRVSEAMNSSLDIKVLINTAVEQGMNALGADTASLMLINEDTGKLEIVSSRGISQKWVAVTEQEVGKSIAGWVAKHGQSVLVSDARKDPRFDMQHFRDDIVSSASVPLKVHGDVIGVLNVCTKLNSKSFDERDLHFMGTLANHIAAAISNARLYSSVNRKTTQLNSLLQIAETITSTLNLNEVRKRFCDEICSLYKMEVSVILMFDEHNGRFRYGYGTGLDVKKKHAYYELAMPLALQVRQSNQPITYKDINASDATKSQISTEHNLKSAMAFSLINNGKMIGIAAAFSKQVASFHTSQKEMMKTLGELVGVAIDNARLYRHKYKMAELLQHQLTPKNIPVHSNYEIGHKFIPAREVGGDYYDFIKIDNNKLSLILGDVSGCDVEAAEYAAMGRHVLRAFARIDSSPLFVLSKTNEHICDDTIAEIFISLFYGVLDLSDCTLTYANAGCEPPILFKRNHNTCQELKTNGILLGIYSGADFEEKKEQLENGDILVLFTDGLTEAGTNKNRFGTQPVCRILEELKDSTATEIAERIYEEVLEHSNGRITDDVAILVIKINL